MRRSLLNLLTALSLLLCVAVATLWLRSYTVGERLSWQWSGAGGEYRAVAVYSGGGGLSAAFFAAAPPDPVLRAQMQSAVRQKPFTREVGPPRYPWLTGVRQPRSLGFQFLHDGAAGPPFRPVPRLGVPYWALLATAAALPAWWPCRRLRGTRGPGHCTLCGYDLRATPGRCPECGNDVSVNPMT